jgi:hypothetical protein
MKIAIIRISRAISRLSFTLGSISLTTGLILSMAITPVLADAIDPGPPTTTLNVQPIGILGNNDCQDLISAEDFLFQFKVEDPGLFGSFPLNYNGMSGTLDIVDGSDELGQAFDFSFSGDFITVAISVKGGPDTNFYDYRPLGGAAADTYLHSQVNPQTEQFYGISHISFCIVAVLEPPTPIPTLTSTNTPTSTPTDTPTATATNTPTSTPTDTPTATVTDTPTFTPTSPTEELTPTPTQTEQPPSPIIDTPTPTAEEPQPSPEPTTTPPPPGPPPVTATSTPTEEQPQVTPESTSTQPPPTPPVVTDTSTPPPTLIPPAQPVTTPVLIPVTGIDFSGVNSQLVLLQQLLINWGLGLLGLTVVFYGITYKFNRS